MVALGALLYGVFIVRFVHEVDPIKKLPLLCGQGFFLTFAGMSVLMSMLGICFDRLVVLSIVW